MLPLISLNLSFNPVQTPALYRDVVTLLRNARLNYGERQEILHTRLAGLTPAPEYLPMLLENLTDSITEITSQEDTLFKALPAYTYFKAILERSEYEHWTTYQKLADVGDVIKTFSELSHQLLLLADWGVEGLDEDSQQAQGIFYELLRVVCLNTQEVFQSLKDTEDQVVVQYQYGEVKKGLEKRLGLESPVTQSLLSLLDGNTLGASDGGLEWWNTTVQQLNEALFNWGDFMGLFGGKKESD